MRLIDADVVKKPIYAEDDNIEGIGMTYDEMDGYNNGIDEMFREIENAPTIDAVPVVRCKDCRFSETYQNDSSGAMALYCKAFTFQRMVEGDDYCSYGEREDGEA